MSSFMEKQKLSFTEIENTAWTIYNFYPKASKDCAPDKHMYDCARAILIVQREGYGDCMLAEEFFEAVDCGGFNPYDGDGYFCDEDGNELGGVWEDDIPEGTKFVMWFNK